MPSVIANRGAAQYIVAARIEREQMTVKDPRASPCAFSARLIHDNRRIMIRSGMVLSLCQDSQDELA